MSPNKVVSVALLICGIVQFAVGFGDETIAEFWYTMGAMSLAAGVAALFLPVRTGKPGLAGEIEAGMLANPVNRKRWRTAMAAVLLLASALFAAVWIFWPWEKHADFDIIGVLWLMQNAVPLTILFVLLFVAAGALAAWFSALKPK